MSAERQPLIRVETALEKGGSEDAKQELGRLRDEVGKADKSANGLEDQWGAEYRRGNTDMFAFYVKAMG